MSGIPEPVPEELRDAYVAAEHDLMWLAGHGRLADAARKLSGLRHMQEIYEEQVHALDARDVTHA